MANGTTQLLRTVQVNCGRALNQGFIILALLNPVDQTVIEGWTVKPFMV